MASQAEKSTMTSTLTLPLGSDLTFFGATARRVGGAADRGAKRFRSRPGAARRPL